MMETVNEKLEKVIVKLQKVLNQYVDLEEAHLKLKEENNKLKHTLGDRNGRISELEEKLRTLQIAKSVDDEDARKEMKQKINEYIREIDKCVALLND